MTAGRRLERSGDDQAGRFPSDVAQATRYKMRLRYVTLALWCIPAVCAAQSGVTTQGASGGLVVPSAHVLAPGNLALTRGDYSEPNLGTFQKRQNYSLGIGLIPNIELFGRFVEYQNPIAGQLLNGPRDISANVKLKLPEFWRGQPTFAVGFNDISGGASLFKSRYGVVSDQWGPVRWSAGYAWGSPILGSSARGHAFDGLFGGVEFLFGQTGLSVLAEYDGQQKHIGARYTSPHVSWLADAQVVATLQRSSGAQDATGRSVDRASAAVSVVIPLEALAQKATTFKPEKTLASLDVRSGVAGMAPTAVDRQESLQKALIAAGLERVRVGVHGVNLVAEYENNRYGQNEADALGLVLGLAAEYAPTGVRRVSAVTLKAGQRVYETSIDVAIFRAYLRDGDPAQARGSLAVDRLPSYGPGDVKWLNAAPARHSPLRVEVKPELFFLQGTDVGTWDYTLAANVQAFVPLWRGAELYASHVGRLSNSENFEQGFVFGAFRQRNGLKVLAVHQGFWLGQHVHANLGVGRYNYDALGVQGEATVFVPGRGDVIRLRGGAYERQPGQSRSQAVPASISYRYVHSPSTWVEAGLQQYSDGTRGPSIVFTRWFGDVSVNLFYRKGGVAQYAGLELSIPLTPRQGMEPGWVQVTGAPQFSQFVRTRLVDSSTSINYVIPNGARDMSLDYNAELHHLNAGRSSQRYFISQLPRMREAFYLYARKYLPQ